MKRLKKIDFEKGPHRKYFNLCISKSKKFIGMFFEHEKIFFKNYEEKFLKYLEEEEERNYMEMEHDKRNTRQETKKNLLNLYKSISGQKAKKLYDN